MTDMTQTVTSNNAIADFLKNNSGDYAPSFKFHAIGDTVGGTITRVQVVQGTNLSNGSPQQNLVVEVTTETGETWAIWIPESKPKMVNAVLAACREAGVAAPMVGDLMRVTFSGETPPSKPGFNPSKDYTAAYKRSSAAPAAPAAAPAAPAQPTADSLI